MAITSRDQLIAAMGNNYEDILFNKNSLSNSASGQYFSLFFATGFPASGSGPSTPEVCTGAIGGSFPFTNPTPPDKAYLARAAIAGSSFTTSYELVDRLAHMGNLSGTVTTVQTVDLDLSVTNPGADRIGNSNYSEVRWWLEVYNQMGATGVNATVNVTYNDDTSGNLTAIALGANPRLGRMYPLFPAVSGKFIKKVNTVTLSATTGTAGNFGITAYRNVASVNSVSSNKLEIFDWAQLGFPEIPSDPCLQLITQCSGTTTGALSGIFKVVRG